MSHRALTASFAVLATAAAAHGQLMVPDLTNSRVLLFDEVDGSLLDASFVDMSAQGGFPVTAVQVGGEIWVSNQTNETIHRYALNGAYVGDVAGDMDYVRGFDVVGGKVYAANVGQNTGHPERTGVAVIDVATATLEEFFPIGSDGQGYGFDVLAFDTRLGTGLLVPDQSSVDEGLDDGEGIDLFATDGSFLATFYDSDGVNGIDNPMQLSLTPRGTVLAAGFTGGLFGIFEYDDQGHEIDFHFVPGTNVFGVYELEDGSILFTTYDGVFRLDTTNPNPATNVEPVVLGVNAGFIEPLADYSARLQAK